MQTEQPRIGQKFVHEVQKKTAREYNLKKTEHVPVYQVLSENQEEQRINSKREQNYLNAEVAAAQLIHDQFGIVFAIKKSTFEGRPCQKEADMQEWIKQFFSRHCCLNIQSGYCTQRIDAGLQVQRPNFIMHQYIVYGIDFMNYYELRDKYRDSGATISSVDPSHIVLTFINLIACDEFLKRQVKGRKIDCHHVGEIKNWVELKGYTNLSFYRPIHLRSMTVQDQDYLRRYRSDIRTHRSYIQARKNLFYEMLNDPQVHVIFEKILNTQIAEKMMKPSFKKNKKAHMNRLRKEKDARLVGQLTHEVRKIIKMEFQQQLKGRHQNEFYRGEDDYANRGPKYYPPPSPIWSRNNEQQPRQGQHERKRSFHQRNQNFQRPQSYKRYHNEPQNELNQSIMRSQGNPNNQPIVPEEQRSIYGPIDVQENDQNFQGSIMNQRVEQNILDKSLLSGQVQEHQNQQQNVQKQFKPDNPTINNFEARKFDSSVQPPSEYFSASLNEMSGSNAHYRSLHSDQFSQGQLDLYSKIKQSNISSIKRSIASSSSGMISYASHDSEPSGQSAQQLLVDMEPHNETSRQQGMKEVGMNSQEANIKRQSTVIQRYPLKMEPIQENINNE